MVIWKNIMLPFESSITDEIMSLNTKLAFIEMIKVGLPLLLMLEVIIWIQLVGDIFKSGDEGAVT